MPSRVLPIKSYDVIYAVADRPSWTRKQTGQLIGYSKRYAHGIRHRVTLSFVDDTDSSARVRYPTGTEGLHFRLYTEREMFGGFRELFESESPLEFALYYDDGGPGETANVIAWVLQTGAEEPVGEDEHMSTFTYLADDEGVPDDIREAFSQVEASEVE